jgi:hypothetical protein
MGCHPLTDPACLVSPIARTTGGAVASGFVSGIAHAIQAGAAWIFATTADWWVQFPSPDLASEPVGALQRWLLPVTVAVAVGAMVVAGGKMALTRKANPLVDVGSGLVIVAAVSAVGVVLPSMLLKAGDAWSSWVLVASTGGHFASRLTEAVTLAGTGPGVVIVLGAVGIFVGAIQAVLMLFRQAALLVLAGVLPLSAAGTLAAGSKAWFRRVTGWMLALIFYKPAAAAVYATAFTLIGSRPSPRTELMGFAMVILSLVALPALMKFFTWTVGTVEASSAGGGFLSTVLSGAVAIGAVRGAAGGLGGVTAADQARVISGRLDSPSAGAQGAQAAGGGSPPGPGSPATGQGPQIVASAGARPAGATATAAGSVPGATAAAAAGPAGAAAAAAGGAAAGAARRAAQATQPPDGST